MRAAQIGLLLLADCGNGPDNRICATAPAQIAQGDMKACVHKWGYRLAGSADSAALVAKAVAQACSDVAVFNTEAASSPGDSKSHVYDGFMVEAEKDALFRVIQGRSGNCAIP